MTVEALPGFPASQSISEYYVGSAKGNCVYPRILQCISITGFSDGGLLGAHISPGATEEDIAKTFEILRSGGGKNILKWFVVGNFRSHYQHTKVGWNSMAKIAKRLRKELSKGAVYNAVDTTDLLSSPGYSWGLDICAKRSSTGITFTHARAGGSPTKAFTTLTLPFSII